jgi:hypothetical protein
MPFGRPETHRRYEELTPKFFLGMMSLAVALPFATLLPAADTQDIYYVIGVEGGMPNDLGRVAAAATAVGNVPRHTPTRPVSRIRHGVGGPARFCQAGSVAPGRGDVRCRPMTSSRTGTGRNGSIPGEPEVTLRRSHPSNIDGNSPQPGYEAARFSRQDEIPESPDYGPVTESFSHGYIASKYRPTA